MQFLNPSLIWPAALLVGIPLVIHLLSRRFPKKFYFSSVEEIRRTIAGRSRVFKWRHLLMLLLRTLALVALLLAFLKPIMDGGRGGAGERRQVILLVDHSLSMAFSENGTSAVVRARREVERFLGALDAGDSFNLIRVDDSPEAAFPQWSTNRAAAVKFLEDSPAPLTGADFAAAHRLAGQLAKGAEGQVEVYYFSDFQRRDWAGVDFEGLPAGAGLFFVHATGDPERPNRAVTEISLGGGAVIAGGRVEAKVRVANHSGEAWVGKVEAGFGPAFLREEELRLAPWSEAEVPMMLPVPRGGLLRLTARIGGDGLAADNVHRVVVRVREKEDVLLLTGEADAGGSPAPLLFLSTAVDPYDGEQGVYRPRYLSPEALTPAALAAGSRLIASRLPELTEEQAGTLLAFLRSGGGVVLFLDGDADAANLAMLEKLSGETLALRLTEKLDWTNLPGGLMKVATGDFQSPFLQLFEGERRQNLAVLEFYELYYAAASGEGKILLSYQDGTPALAQNTVGLGTLLTANFSVAETASNLSRQRLFPAWVHELLNHLHGNNSAAEETYLVGDRLSGEIWATEVLGRELKGPQGEVVVPRMDTLGERVRIGFEAKGAGFYHLPGADGGDLLGFAVNTDAAQSDLRAMDPTVLPDRAAGRAADFLDGTQDYARVLRGLPIAHWFLLAALGFFFLEGLLFKVPPRVQS